MTLFVVIISQITCLQQKAWGRLVLVPFLNKIYPKNPNLEDISDAEEKYLSSAQINSLHRKNFCRLLLKLIQSVDMELKELAKKILLDSDIHPGKFLNDLFC